MKKIIVYIMILFTGFCFSQNKPNFDYPYIEGDFTVEQIIEAESYYYVNIINKEGVKILILQDKPKKRTIRKYASNSDVKKLELGKTYFFKLQSRTWNMGFGKTGSFTVDGQEIWNRKISDFNLCYSENLIGLIYVSKK